MAIWDDLRPVSLSHYPKFVPKSRGPNRMVSLVRRGHRRYFENMVIDFDRLAPDVKDYINAQVSEGVYFSAEEVLEDAVRRLRQADEERHERLLKALAKGEKGEGIPYSRELMDKIAEDARRDMWSGKPMDPDVVG